MSSVPSNPRDHDLLVVPDSLKEQLASFRGRVWSTKMLESVVIGAVAVLLAFLTVYCVDRFVDTPVMARIVIFFVALGAWLAVPYALHRWVWSNRRLEQLARLLRVREPGVGDQLLSVIELAENEDEQARSRTLCAAAIEQVAETAKGRDFAEAAPTTKLRPLGLVLGACAATAVGLALFFPEAASNAWARFSAPWKDTPRYTFTTIEPLDQNLVVPHGEQTSFIVNLNKDSKWQPDQAKLQFPGLPAFSADRNEGEYGFEIPPQVEPTEMKMTVGDYYKTISVEPKLRPELTEAKARVTLPDYLERSEPLNLDVRSGTLTAVKGSEAIVTAYASRDLLHAKINDKEVEAKNDSFQTVRLSMEEESSKLKMEWQDHDGLAGREPFLLSIKPVDDEFPTVVSQDFPRQAVVLDSEQINFMALTADDFGIKRIGISWKGLDDRLVDPASGGKGDFGWRSRKHFDASTCDV